MGNAHSTAGHHNRLSKPKTNTNSPHASPKVDISDSASKAAELRIWERKLLKEQLTSPIDTEFGSGCSSDEDGGIGELATHVQTRLSSLSRSNSIVSQLGSGRNSRNKLANLPGSKLSVVSDAHAVDLNTALKIIHEVRKTASPEDLAALNEALSPTPSPIPADTIQPGDTTLNRSSSSLMRRRSLQAVPGLATRGASTDGKYRWRSWKTPARASFDQPWQVEMMGKSPLAQLASLNMESDCDSPTPRACTPGEMDYSHLGFLQLGSLVVTNGVASPAATPIAKPGSKQSIAQRFPPESSQDEDYFTASEGCESPISWKLPRRSSHETSKSSALPPAPPIHRELPDSYHARHTKAMSKCDSPLKIQAPSQNDMVPAPGAGLKVRLHVVNKSADTLARSYQEGLATSPFEESMDSHTEDEGFVDERVESAQFFREEAIQMFEGTMFRDKRQSHRSVVSPPEFQNQPQPRHSMEHARRRKNRPVARQIDSGYSSGGSFKAVERESNRDGTIPTLSKKPPKKPDLQKCGNGSDSEDTASIYTFEQMLRLPESQKPLPPTPISSGIEKLDVKRSSEISMRETSRIHVDDSSIMSPSTSVMSQNTTDSRVSLQKRLQKRRPSAPSMPVVQACQPVEKGTIPGPPEHIRTQFTRRLSGSPAMECLTRTYPSVDHVKSDDSPACSTESLAAAPFEFPSSSPTPARRHHKRSLTESGSTPSSHAQRRSFSFFRSNRATANTNGNDIRSETPVVNVLDLGTVASALGQSPYDAALSPTAKKHAALSPTHPHQLGNALATSKSVANMDAKTAAELARSKSKDRALRRPDLPTRPKSYHDLKQLEERSAFYKRHALYPDESSNSTAERQQTPELDDDAASSHYSEDTTPQSTPGRTFKSRIDGRGPVVSQLINKYDVKGPGYGTRQLHSALPVRPEWDSHARLWAQRRKSIGEGLRQQAEVSQALRPRLSVDFQRATSQPPELVCDRYSGGLDYGYERGYGVGGSAGTRQLHSAASRKSMHFSEQYGVDLSDVPIFLQRQH